MGRARVRRGRRKRRRDDDVNAVMMAWVLVWYIVITDYVGGTARDSNYNGSANGVDASEIDEDAQRQQLQLGGNGVDA